MDIRILKKPVTYCTICDDVAEMRNAWDAGQKLLVESGEQEEVKLFPGVPGYEIRDNDDHKYGYNSICDNCMHTLMKGVKLIIDQKLTGISISNGNK